MDFRLETKRLILRRFCKTDNIDLLELNADPQVMQYTGDRPFKDIEEVDLFIQNYDQYEKYGMGRWAVVDKNDEQFLGWCGLKKNLNGEVDLGFRFKRRHWGKGFASESALACIKYGFECLSLDKIIGRTSLNNKAGQKVLERCGFLKKKIINYEEIGQSYLYVIHSKK